MPSVVSKMSYSYLFHSFGDDLALCLVHFPPGAFLIAHWPFALGTHEGQLLYGLQALETGHGTGHLRPVGQGSVVEN